MNSLLFLSLHSYFEQWTRRFAPSYLDHPGPSLSAPGSEKCPQFTTDMHRLRFCNPGGAVFKLCALPKLKSPWHLLIVSSCLRMTFGLSAGPVTWEMETSYYVEHGARGWWEWFPLNATQRQDRLGAGCLATELWFRSMTLEVFWSHFWWLVVWFPSFSSPVLETAPMVLNTIAPRTDTVYIYIIYIYTPEAALRVL